MLKLALMGFHPGLCCCALSALGFVFSSLEAYSQQSRSKKVCGIRRDAGASAHSAGIAEFAQRQGEF